MMKWFKDLDDPFVQIMILICLLIAFVTFCETLTEINRDIFNSECRCEKIGENKNGEKK